MTNLRTQTAFVEAQNKVNAATTQAQMAHAMNLLARARKAARV